MKSVKSTVKSTWTPLSKDETNAAIFEERRNLLNKWFAKWTDEQRRKVLDDLVRACSQPQLEHLHEATRPRVPLHRADFTRLLPRSLSLLLLSYLDPRSLCRAAQVSWYWNWLCDSDEVWLPKCARLGWFLPAQAHRDVESFTFWTGKAATPGVYKRLYLENLTSLQVEGPTLKEMQRLQETARRQEEAKARKAKAKREAELAKKRSLSGAVWRAPDKHPVDTMRYNYLDSRDIQLMESRRKDPQPLNTMRSVVLTGTGKLPPTAAATIGVVDAASAKRHAVNIRALHQRLQSDTVTRGKAEAPLSDNNAQTVDLAGPVNRGGGGGGGGGVGSGAGGGYLVETLLDGQLTQSRPWTLEDPDIDD